MYANYIWHILLAIPPEKTQLPYIISTANIGHTFNTRYGNDIYFISALCGCYSFLQFVRLKAVIDSSFSRISSL